MKRSSLISIILILSLAAVSGCGHRGGGDDSIPPARIALTSSKAVVLANGSDAVTIEADVRTSDGAAVTDGTAVSFTVPSGAVTLSATQAATTSGLASVTLTHPPISAPDKNQTVVVMGSSGAVTDITDVKFINQPAAATVSILVSRAIPNLGALQFKLNNTNGATFDNTSIGPVNAAAGSAVVGNFNAAGNSTSVALINAAGFETDAAPIIQATFAVTGTGLPAFSVDATAPLTALDATGNAITPALTAADMVVTVRFDTE